jgi:asparagine synthase (glutamine-hydrolysing)
MLDRAQAVDDTWRCWLFGEPQDRGVLAARFGLQAAPELPMAFGRALAELGERACDLLCGRFVTVMLDSARDRCIVARDQLGAQPLVYAHVAGGVLFAEHECDLLELLPRSPGPDRLALLEWIESSLTPRGRTLYEGVQRLPAGHKLNLEGTRVNQTPWWNLAYEGLDSGTTAELGEHLRQGAFAAVERALATSRRPAVKLSGGLDSACVAAGVTADGPAHNRAIAIGGTFSSYPAADEHELIEATAHHAGLPLELIEFDSSSSMLAPALAHIARWRLPPATPNLFLWQPVMARARELGVDVMLDGEGGDELFGSAPYLIADRLRAGRVHAAWSLAGRIPGIGLHPDRGTRARVLRRYGLRPLAPSAIRRRRAQHAAIATYSIIPRADAGPLVDLRVADEQPRHHGPMWWRYRAQSILDARDLLDMGGHFCRESIDEQIDLRHPFVHDLQLIEAALRMPPEAQLDPVRDRLLLREALRGLIPEAVRTRNGKSHFTPLVLDGIRAEEAGLIEPLRQADAPIRAYVAASGLDRKIEVPAERRLMLGAGSLWRVAIANRWLASQTDDRS